MIGVKQQFEKERKEQDAKLEQLVIHQETENVQIRQKVKEIQGIVENNKVETAREIMTVKVAIDMIQKELESSTSNVSRQLREQESRLEQNVNVDQLKLQSELKSLEQEIVQLKLKVGNQMRIPVERTGVVTDGSAVNARGDVNKGSSNLESVKATGNLGSTEFALPLFDEDKGMNPVSHIRQLEEFFEFRGIQQQLWLIVAKKSIVGSVSKQWLEATGMTFVSYEQFKSEFLSTWWSAAQQGLVKCRLYQSKYDKATGLSLSAHFLKYATMASYLEPKLTDNEIIEALRCHYPQEIQKNIGEHQIKQSSKSFGSLKET